MSTFLFDTILPVEINGVFVTFCLGLLVVNLQKLAQCIWSLMTETCTVLVYSECMEIGQNLILIHRFILRSYISPLFYFSYKHHQKVIFRYRNLAICSFAYSNYNPVMCG